MKVINFSKKPSAKAKQRGQGMSEYIIVVALIAVGAIGVFTAFGGTIRSQVAGMANELSGKSGAADVTAAQGSATAGSTAAGKVTNMGTYTGQAGGTTAGGGTNPTP